MGSDSDLPVMKPAAEMRRLFRHYPDAIAETIRFAELISFSLDQLKYQYPDEPVPPGKTAQQHLEIDMEGFVGGLGRRLPEQPGVCPGQIESALDPGRNGPRNQ